MCKISIIMPVYNKEKYVRRAIESILAQTFTDWELIIINDGSTDRSLEICREYQNNKIHVFAEKNGGVSRARNIGLKHAVGTYVTFVDGDDTISPLYLENLIVDGSQMVISGLSRKTPDGQIVSEVLPFYTGKCSMSNLCKEFYQQELKNGIYGFVAGKIVKKSIIEEYEIRFDENIRLAEDYDFFIKVYQHIDEIVFVQKSYYYYFDENEDSFNIKFEDIPSQIEIQMRTYDFLKKYQAFSEYDKKVMSGKIGGLIYTYLITCNANSYKQFRKYLDIIRNVQICLQYNIQSVYAKVVLMFYKKKMDIILYWLLGVHKLIRQ